MQGGVAYVYLVYGMHNMLNVVTGEKNYPSALLIRALEPLDENLKDRKIYSGPGKLSKALGIDRGMNGKTVYTKKNNLWIESGDSLSQDDICRAKRIGVDYAGASKELEWRFYIKNNPFVSDYKKNKS